MLLFFKLQLHLNVRYKKHIICANKFKICVNKGALILFAASYAQVVYVCITSTRKEKQY